MTMRVSAVLLLLAIDVTALCILSPADSTFISIDCGYVGEAYQDQFNVTWVPDTSFIPSGKTATVTTNNTLSKPLATLRYFPTGKKNCYAVPGIPLGTKILMRATFAYGNYDGLDSSPEFFLLFDGNHWNTIELSNETEFTEAIYVTRAPNVSVCLLRSDPQSVPFISALVFRTLGTDMYRFQDPNRALVTAERLAFGAASGHISYPHDVYDRIWTARSSGAVGSEVTILNNTARSFNMSGAPDLPPAEVLKHSMTLSNKSEYFLVVPTDVQLNLTYYITLFFSEVKPNISRRQAVFLASKQISNIFTPPYGSVTEIVCPYCSLIYKDSLYLSRPDGSLPPIVSAVELFLVSQQITNAATDMRDVNALKVLQGAFQHLKLWSGDPCLPVGSNWEWIDCNTDKQPRVIGLHLNGSGLTGSLPDFTAMTALQIIDLSNNSLSGDLPKFLSTFPNLTYLNVLDSGLTGCLQLPNNTHFNLIENRSCNSSNNENDDQGNRKGGDRRTSNGKKVWAIVGACIGSIVFLVVATAVVLCLVKRRKLSHPKLTLPQTDAAATGGDAASTSTDTS